MAFGDDYADIGMLELCGTSVAMGNAIHEVKEKADVVIGSNDEEGIADYIELILTEKSPIAPIYTQWYHNKEGIT